MGFLDDLPAPEPAPPRRQHPWEPPDAEFPGNVPLDTSCSGGPTRSPWRSPARYASPEKPTTPASNGNPADVIHRQDLTCDADPLSARPVPGFGHPVACPAPGGLAELPGQLALGQRPARLEAGAVGGHRGGVDIPVRASSVTGPGEPEDWSAIWSAWPAAFQPGPPTWSAPVIPCAGGGLSAPQGVRPATGPIRLPGPASGS